MKFTEQELRELGEKGFDPDGFERVWEDYRAGRWDRDLVVDPSRISPPDEEVLVAPPVPPAPDHEGLAARGREAMDAGRVGILILNGGMATRFGGVVKGTVDVVDGRSFLQLKIGQIRKVAPGAHIYLMNSPATHEKTLVHLDERGIADERIHHFVQPVAPRISMDGEVVREQDGSISVNGMGHGDTLTAFRDQCLSGFARAGGETVMVSNVDNLGAALDPALVGLHLQQGKDVSVEVARRKPADRGGMPVLLDGRVVLLEGMRWPEGLDGPGYRAFNTNTFYIQRRVFEDPPVLDAYPVTKKVRGQPVVQFERILGEVTHHVLTSYILVEQQGQGSRFIPVKKRKDLAEQREIIVACLRPWGVL